MRKIWNKGHRIRASDKHLVYHFSIGTLVFQYHSCQLLTVQELLETVVTEAVIQKSDQCTNTSRYQYGYEVVRGKRQAILKQAEMLPIGTHELFDIQ